MQPLHPLRSGGQADAGDIISHSDSSISKARETVESFFSSISSRLGMGIRPSLMTSVNIVEFDPQLVPFGKGHIPQKIRAHSSCKSFGAICEGPRTSQDKRHIVIIIRELKWSFCYLEGRPISSMLSSRSSSTYSRCLVSDSGRCC